MRQCGYCPKALLGRINLPSFDLRCRDPDPFARRMIAELAHDTQKSPYTQAPGRLDRIAVERMHEHGLDGSYTEWKSLSDGEGRFLVIRVNGGRKLHRGPTRCSLGRKDPGARPLTYRT